MDTTIIPYKYFNIKNFDKDEVEILRASCAIPFVSNIVKYQGKLYLDGGMADAIPLKKSESDGYEKNVVILTKSPSFVRKKSSANILIKLKYRKYPKFVKVFANRHHSYAEAFDYVNKRAQEGSVFLIQPLHDGVSRLEKNINKLTAAYQEGYDTAKKRYPELIKFMGK